MGKVPCTLLARIRSRGASLLAAVLLLTATSLAFGQARALPVRTLQPVLPPISGILGTTPADKIEVIQFFYYGCPHCFDQQPLIDDWLRRKPADVEFRYVPALRDDKWIPLTKAWFVLEKLGHAARLHRPIYDVINFDGVQLSDEAKLFEWIGRNGVERNTFIEVYNSEEIKAKLEEARKLTAAYGIRATPTLVVAGKYAFSSGAAGSHYEAMRLLDQHITLARNEKK